MRMRVLVILLLWVASKFVDSFYFPLQDSSRDNIHFVICYILKNIINNYITCYCYRATCAEFYEVLYSEVETWQHNRTIQP